MWEARRQLLSVEFGGGCLACIGCKEAAHEEPLHSSRPSILKIIDNLFSYGYFPEQRDFIPRDQGRSNNATQEYKRPV